MLGRLRMDVETATRYFDNLAKNIFSRKGRLGNGKFSATKLQEAIKSMVLEVTGDSESPLLEHSESSICRV